MLTVDTTVALPGLPVASPAEPRDVVRFDPATSAFSVYFDGAANSVPTGVAIDAEATGSSGELLLSFDTAVALPGAGTVDDEDLVAFAAGSYSPFFDGSAQGLATDLDLDAAHRVGGPNPKLLLSFDGSGTIGGIPFDDEDVLAFDTTAHTWSMYFDGSASDQIDWPAADLIALPEPALASFLVGAGALVGFAHFSAHRSRKCSRSMPVHAVADMRDAPTRRSTST